VTIIQPSPYDDVTHPPKFEGGYNAVLVKFGEYLKGLAQSRGLETVDFNTPVVAMLHKAGSIDPELAKTLMPDRVHPSPGGHLIMTEALLRSWNFPRVISAISIDAGAGKVVQADGAVVTNLGATGPTIKWESLESALPLPIDFSDPTIALAIKSSDVIDAIDQETLKITGLSAPKYELRIDYSLVGAFTNDQLAAGVNLATLRTPMLGQALGVAAIVNWHLAVGGRYRTMMAPLQTDPDPGVKQALAAMAGQLSALDAALAAEEHGIVMKQRAAAQPITRHFVLTPAP